MPGCGWRPTARHHHGARLRDGAGRDDGHAAADRGGNGPRLGQGEDRAGAAHAEDLRQPALRRQHGDGRLAHHAGLLRNHAARRHAGARDHDPERRAPVESARRRADDGAAPRRAPGVRPQDELRRNRRVRGSAGEHAADHARQAEAAEPVPPDRQGRPAGGRTGQGFRPRAVRNRRAPAGDALRHGAARACQWRGAREHRRRRGAQGGRCEADRAHALRSRRDRLQLPGGAEGEEGAQGDLDQPVESARLHDRAR